MFSIISNWFVVLAITSPHWITFAALLKISKDFVFHFFFFFRMSVFTNSNFEHQNRTKKMNRNRFNVVSAKVIVDFDK